MKSAPVRVIFTWKSVPKKRIHGSSDIYLGTQCQWKQRHDSPWSYRSTRCHCHLPLIWHNRHYRTPWSSIHGQEGLIDARGVTIRLATIRYISRYTTHDMVHDTIQNQLIYYQWKILKHCGMCHQYCYIKTVILARNSEFKINKDVHNHPCPKYLLLTNCVCKQNNKIS